MKSWPAEWRHVGAWLALPVLAVLNGFIRDTTYGQSMATDVAHNVSVIPLLAAVFVWAAFLARRWPLSGGMMAFAARAHDERDARRVRRRPWQALAADPALDTPRARTHGPDRITIVG
jgi:hypothetical protein